MTEVRTETVEERVARGRAARADAPRSSHGEWVPPRRRDPVAILQAQAATRIPELVPIRHGRMLSSPFAFFRGAAAVMAADLAATPRSGLQAQLCGDAHLSNFGGFATPERHLVFSLNDFDESLPGPWEWDVKRLVASLAIAGRELGIDERTRRSVVLRTAAAYRGAMRDFAGMGHLQVWYARLDAEGVLSRWSKRASGSELRAFSRAIDKAHTRDSLAAFGRLARIVDGEPRLVAQPPLIVPIEDIATGKGHAEIERQVTTILRAYRRTLQGDRRRLLDGFRYVHAARKVVGVGSVGSRAWIVLLMGRDSGDPLLLQVKEAEASVLERHLVPSRFANHGQRVVEGQRLMQEASDIFLGWHRMEGVDGRVRDFYVRQLWDWKRSASVETMSPGLLAVYGEMCGWTLARAHARSGDRIAIAAYLGAGDVFDRALQSFAEAYADQNERDHRALADAAASGRIAATTGV